jgi:hypothetical protein
MKHAWAKMRPNGSTHPSYDLHFDLQLRAGVGLVSTGGWIGHLSNRRHMPHRHALTNANRTTATSQQLNFYRITPGFIAIRQKKGYI